MRNRRCCKKKTKKQQKKHLCFRLASHAEFMLTSSSHTPETFPSKEPQQTLNCFCCFQSHQNILPSLEMSTIPACATATGEGGSESFFFFFFLHLLALITWRAEWNLEATLFSRLHFSITGPTQPAGSRRESSETQRVSEPGLRDSPGFSLSRVAVT